MSTSTKSYHLQIVLHVENLGHYTTRDSWIYDTSEEHYQSRRSLQLMAVLRQVNRAFCRSATPRLFRCINATLHSFPYDSPLLRLVEISKSPYNIYVRRVEFGTGSIDWDVVAELYLDSLERLLQCCLQSFPTLKALSFNNLDWFSLSEDFERRYSQTINAALCCIPLPNLTELEIVQLAGQDGNYFLCSDLGSCKISTNRILQRLRHLTLHGFGQSSGWFYRGDKYNLRLLDVAKQAVSLQSLTICDANVIDIDSITFHCSLPIRYLCLKRVFISSKTLLSFLDQCKGTIKCIELCEVWLKSGTWENVLSHISDFPLVLDARAMFCGRSYHDATGPFAVLYGPRVDGPKTGTQDHLGNSSLGNLQRRVNANRVAAGMKPFSEDVYEWVGQTSPEMEAPEPEG